MNQSSLTRNRVAVVIIGTLLLFTVALLPLAVQGVATDILQPQAAHIYHLTSASIPPASTHSRLHIDLVSLDAWQGTLHMRIWGTHICQSACAWKDRFLFVSTFGHGESLEGLPPSVAVTFPPSGMELEQDIALPLVGQPIRYPFDAYRLELGVIMQRVFPDGTVQVLSPEQAQGHLVLSMHNYLPQLLLELHTRDPHLPAIGAGLYQYAYLTALTLTRPRYLQVATVLLVLLISAFAVYAVVIQEFPTLITSTGATVLGVWGVRAILVGTAMPGITALDLALTVVILFLLVAVVVHALAYHVARSGLHWRTRRPPPAPERTKPPST